MYIALNAQLLNTAASYRSAGVSRYCAGLLRHLGETNGGLEFTAFVNEQDINAPGINLERSPLPLQQPLARIAWEQTVLPARLRALNVDLVHGLVNVLPLATRVPGVVTVHDLSFLHGEDRRRRLKQAYLRRLCRVSVHQARQVIAVSQQTANDLVRGFGVPAARVCVIPNGVDPRFAPAAPKASRAFRVRKGLPSRFVLYVGTLEPRKNLAALVRAFVAWQRAHPAQRGEIKLVLGGAMGWYADEILGLVKELDAGRDVLFPGYVADVELPDWYRAAELFVYPSRFEGFGLPVLEAMACGTPVLCSDIPALREIAADAALTFAPDDERALLDGLSRGLAEAALRADLSARGLARAAKFSWAATARETVGVYQNLRL